MGVDKRDEAGSSEPRGAGDAAARKRPRRLEMDQLYNTLQQEAPTLVKLRTNSIGLKLVLLPEGTFAMGSPDTETHHRLNEGPVHEIILTQPIYIGIHPVTQAQYQQVMGRNPARFQRENGGGLEHPVETVSWEDAQLFCQKLSAMPDERQEGIRYRMPTEAEWEYACRAGTRSPFSFGDDLNSIVANLDGNFPYPSTRKGSFLARTSRVGSYPANHFGLFDMHGNVWEWCNDWYESDYYSHSAPRDPKGPPEGTMRVVRGGSWRNHAVTCRSAYRNALMPHNRDPYTGFRVVASISMKAEA